MKIKKIELNNYKAFRKKHIVNFECKNIFIYGENGSGKSSLYYALKDFFQSSVEDIDMNSVENIFIDEGEKNQNYIEVTFRSNNSGQNIDKTYCLKANSKTTNSDTDTSIKDAYKFRSFLTYKTLLDIHHIKKSQKINLFDLLVKGVLKHFKYTLTNGKEIGEMWGNVEELIKKETDRNYRINEKQKEVDKALKEFNRAFGQLFTKPTEQNPNPEYILNHTIPILSEFEKNLTINLFYKEATTKNYKNIERNEVSIELFYCGEKIQKPHLFLNEAKLSAIAISIYLGMIKRYPQMVAYKVLFLDDIFIGLDISNRLPLLKILDTNFGDYQIFITTYDKPWYEYVKSILGSKWKCLEFYSSTTKEGYEIPYLCDNEDLIQKAKKHLKELDYKASAVYARSAFEKILRKYCSDKRKKVGFKIKQKDYTSQDFWTAVKRDLKKETITSIETYRFLIYNKLSHYDPEATPFKSELINAIKAVEELRKELKAK